jgi:CRISPR-associated protein Cas5 subtype I-A
MKAYLVTLRFHWGYSIRNYFASKVTDTYTIPPLNTVIGALAMANCARNGIHVENVSRASNAKNFALRIKYAAFMFKYRPIKFTSLLRYSTSIYWLTTYDVFQRGTRLSELFNAMQFGLNSYLNGIMNMLIVTDLDKADLYSITRLGSKESIVSVLDVKEVAGKNITKVNKGSIIKNVTFSFNKDLAESIIGNFFIETIPSYNEAFYNFFMQPMNIATESICIPNPIVSLITSKEVCLFSTDVGNAIGPSNLW